MATSRHFFKLYFTFSLKLISYFSLRNYISLEFSYLPIESFRRLMTFITEPIIHAETNHKSTSEFQTQKISPHEAASREKIIFRH